MPCGEGDGAVMLKECNLPSLGSLFRRRCQGLKWAAFVVAVAAGAVVADAAFGTVAFDAGLD